MRYILKQCYTAFINEKNIVANEMSISPKMLASKAFTDFIMISSNMKSMNCLAA